jgi:hypothetical protein
MCLLLHQRRWRALAHGHGATPTTPSTRLSTSTAGRLQWASVLLPEVTVDVEARRMPRQATRSAVWGCPQSWCSLIAYSVGSMKACTCWQVLPAWGERPRAADGYCGHARRSRRGREKPARRYRQSRVDLPP